ncbi:hypothetical protein DSCO28_64570 [Desulfosarcina ovata subsp. sediminis]|uniref:Uncharacterized protein n=1 Tax=Desulfosarcina ovata subsp. sediminis TaxID=885957 RepID=A0A5K7ZJV6_9BACT|nr:hypothetical protein DSCO28_02240 [Desulfosarcina ovata subsp. sediminis]BBO80448.1 hypothetical protein DSCO28_10140 [Desulfosarcina ovata subsp. sediminis]BBO80525.1 hypothetical protein DSCO28_10910 [Desulfosarcina ovata subsp. sediminis]BBO83916.1 hypothetical protein DSCO28_44820 [Desulfosarcina ovata subsp. sediminis]BBO83923.1 hypothetical protein DSCO28_44890 [Desulfosarcina ovata subsp. sediminis]
MTSMKTSKQKGTEPSLNKKMVEGEDVPFGPPPVEYNYRCSHCQYEMKVNEAIIDVEIAIAEFEGRNVRGFMPVLGCPHCNREAMKFAAD